MPSKTELGGNGHLPKTKLQSVSVRNGESQLLVPQVFQDLLLESQTEISDFFQNPKKHLETTVDWQDPAVPNSYQLPLEVFAKHNQCELILDAMKYMVEKWGEQDKKYNESTKTHELCWDRSTPIADIDLNKGSIVIKLGEDLEDSMLRVKSVVGALIPRLNRSYEENEVKYQEAKRKLEEQVRNDFEFCSWMNSQIKS